MRFAHNDQQTLPLTANPRFLDRLIAVCSIAMAGLMLAMIWLALQPKAGVFDGQPIQIRVHAPDTRPAVPAAPAENEIAASRISENPPR